MRTEWLTQLDWGHPVLEGLWRASWQGALWAGLVWALARALPRMPSALRAALWWLVCLKFVLSLGSLEPVPLPLLPAPPSAPVAATVGEPALAVPPKEGTWVAPRAAVASPEAGPGWRAWSLAGLAAWGLGIAWQLRGHLKAWSTVRRLRRRALPLRHPQVEETLRELATAAGLRRVPRLLVSGEVTSPLATGLLSTTWRCARGWPSR